MEKIQQLTPEKTALLIEQLHEKGYMISDKQIQAVRPKLCSVCSKRAVYYDSNLNMYCKQHGRPPVVAERTPRRNEPCFCGSGKKYKHCCLNK